MDIAALTAAISNPTDLVFISRNDIRTRGLLYAGVGGNALNWISSSRAPEATIIALDCNSLTMSEGGFEFESSSETLLVNIDETPVPEPLEDSTQSLWQIDAYSLRLLSFVSWALRGSGRAASVSPIKW